MLAVFAEMRMLLENQNRSHLHLLSPRITKVRSVVVWSYCQLVNVKSFLTSPQLPSKTDQSEKLFTSIDSKKLNKKINESTHKNLQLFVRQNHLDRAQPHYILD